MPKMSIKNDQYTSWHTVRFQAYDKSYDQKVIYKMNFKKNSNCIKIIANYVHITAKPQKLFFFNLVY